MFTNDNLKSVALIMLIQDLAEQVKIHGIMSKSVYQELRAKEDDTKKSIMDFTMNRPAIYENESYPLENGVNAHKLVKRYDVESDILTNVSTLDLDDIDICAIEKDGKSAEIMVRSKECEVIILATGKYYFKNLE